MAIAKGDSIGPYEIVGWLGAGGMGVVYRARDSRLGRDVAIKLIPESLAIDAGRLRRFEQEARAAGQLNHPNIVAVHDIGAHAGAPYIVTELLEGESLRSRLEGGALPPRKAVDYARQTAVASAAAHDKGIVHRDVKPDNLFITADGRIKILDFGIAKLITPNDDETRHTGRLTETAEGMVVGTAGYMSPEQVRGEAVDARSDIFSVGTVLYEMLTGQPAFTRATVADTMAAILKEDPREPLPAGVSPALERIVARCLEKPRETRFQSARDLAFGLEVLSDTGATAVPAAIVGPRHRWPTTVAASVGVLSLLAVVASWLIWGTAPPPIESRLAKATYTPLATSEGAELDAAISPDGNFVAFLAPKKADRSVPLADSVGRFHVWLSRVGTASSQDLTPDEDNLRNRQTSTVGFSADGSEIWICGTPYGRRMRMMPYIGGTPRVFLEERAIMASWASDGSRLVYYTYDDGDPLYVADGTGGNPRQIHVGKRGDHNHFPTWSPDGQWIYYVHYVDEADAADLWRIPSSGGTPERLTRQYSDVRFPTPIDAHTLLYVARDGDGSGPWLWALDVDRGVPPRRVSVGLNRYLSVGASANGRRLVVTDSKASADLWSVPILDRLAEDSDIKPYALPAARALAPRFGGGLLFYLSSNGAGDGLWRLQEGKPVEVWKGSDGALLGPAAVSADGTQVAVALRTQGLAHLTVVSADGAKRRSLAEGIHVPGTVAWSPDARWIVTGGRDDADGPGLFKIPVDGGRPVRLVTGQAVDPVWSPSGDLIVYSGPLAGGTAPLLAVRPDGSPVNNFPTDIKTSNQGGGSSRFLDGKRLVYLQSPVAIGARGFWLLDLTTNTNRQLARLPNSANTSTFDITPDGKQIVFDRLLENSDVVLIDLPK